MRTLRLPEVVQACFRGLRSDCGLIAHADRTSRWQFSIFSGFLARNRTRIKDQLFIAEPVQVLHYSHIVLEFSANQSKGHADVS